MTVTNSYWKQRRISLDETLTKDFLIEHCIKNGLSIAQLARKLNCCATSIVIRLKLHGIYDDLSTVKTRKYWAELDLSGQRHGKLTVLHRHPAPGGNPDRWACKCDCGNIKYIRSNELILQAHTSCTACAPNKYQGYKDISKTYWNTITLGAERRGHVFDISMEQVWDLYIRQDKKCAISGVDITFRKKGELRTASIDRIDSHIGYVLGNIQIIHKRLQFIKGSRSMEELLMWCRHIYKHHQSRCDSLCINEVLAQSGDEKMLKITSQKMFDLITA